MVPVKGSLIKVEGVRKADVSREKAEDVVTLDDAKINVDALRSAVTKVAVLRLGVLLRTVTTWLLSDPLLTSSFCGTAPPAFEAFRRSPFRQPLFRSLHFLVRQAVTARVPE